jgi:hypothetical protein
MCEVRGQVQGKTTKNQKEKVQWSAAKRNGLSWTPSGAEWKNATHPVNRTANWCIGGCWFTLAQNVAFAMNAGSSPYWLSFAVKYEGGPGDIQSVMIRQVSNKQTPATTRRKCPLQFFCKFFLWKVWNWYVILTLILTTLAAGWLGSCACVCSLVATSGSQCYTTGVRVGCWSTTGDNLSKVLSTFRS